MEKNRQSKLVKLEKKIFELQPEKELPKDNLPSERIKIELTGRTLYADWVSNNNTAPAFFILHGDGETLSDWRPLQAYLLQKGYSTFVFDYTGFGSSTGTPSVNYVNEDAIEAYKKFATLTKFAKEKIAFAHSLGCAILLEDANKFYPLPNKVITHGAFTSAKDILVEAEIIKENERKDYPNFWNSIENVKKLKIPLYILHSRNDKTIELQMGEQLANGAGKNGRLLILETPGHNAVYQIPTDSTWEPILQFLK